MPPAGPTVIVSPIPTEEEMAAIMGAYLVLWPHAVEPVATAPVNTRWRFANRWWHERS